jgi:sulfotransferase family protein
MADLLLNSSSLQSMAEEATQLHDWGADPSFLIGLDHLVAAINAMQAPTAFVEQARTRLLTSLTTLLHFVEDARQYPDILGQDIDQPMVVVGLPRTGTTVLYDLLGLDFAVRTPRDWEFFLPWPAPEAASWDHDPRIAQINGMNAQILAMAPALADIHEFEATHSSECNLAFTHHFASTQFIAEWGVPEYEKWLIDGPVPGRYAAHRRILQQLQWKGPEGRWLLKSPEHLFNLEGLLEAYPDASLVWTHRDPVMALSSLSSFLLQFRNILGLYNDPEEVGRSVFETWTAALERGIESRNRNPDIDRKVIDISHREVIADKAGVVRRIYERFGLRFTPELEAQVRAEAEAADTARFGRLGKHKHSPATFGIDAARVRERMPKYYARFGSLFE